MEITREYIENLKPGREMDILVHKYVLNKCPHELEFLEQDGDYRAYKCKHCGKTYAGLAYRVGMIVCPNYSTDIKDVQEVVDKYKEDFLINFMTPYRGFGYGWHCNINGIHSMGGSTQMEVVCKASLIYALELWNESEKYQVEKHKAIEKGEPELINELSEKIQALESERLYSKQEINNIFGYKR